MIELAVFIGLGGVDNVFSHVSLILVATSSIFAKLLLTNFFAPFLAARESNFLSCFSYHWHSKLVHRTCTPMFLVQNAWVSWSKTLVGTCFLPHYRWLTLFCLLPKVSAVNVHWTEHNSHLSFSQKSSDRHFLVWPWPSQATQYSLGMESPKGYPNSWLGWLSLVLWQLPCALLKAIVWAFLATKSFAAGSSTYPCHMACVSKSVTKDVIFEQLRPQQHRSAVDETWDSLGWSLSVPFLQLWGSGV